MIGMHAIEAQQQSPNKLEPLKPGLGKEDKTRWSPRKMASYKEGIDEVLETNTLSDVQKKVENREIGEEKNKDKEVGEE